MASVSRDNSFAQTALATSATPQYKPLDTTMSDWFTRTENQRNYAKAQLKQKELSDNENFLAGVAAMGYPKEMQGELNADVNSLLEGVRNGKIDPSSYDFKAGIAGIKGKSNQFDQTLQAIKDGIAKNGEIIEMDENGNPINRKGEYVNGIKSIYSNEYDPNNPISARQNQLIDPFLNQTTPLSLDEKDLNTLANDYIERNASENTDIQALQKQGYSGYDLITKLETVDPQLAEGFNKSITEGNTAALTSEYVTYRDYNDKVGKPSVSFEEFKKQRMTPWTIPSERIKSQEIDTTRHEEGQKSARQQADLAAKNKETEQQGFGAVVTPINSTDVTMEMIKGMNKEEQDAFIKANPSVFSVREGGKVDIKNVTKKIEVSPKKAGTPLEEIELNGVKGTLGQIYVDDNGNGFAVMNTTKDITENTGSKQNPKYEKTKRIDRAIVPIDNSNLKYLSKFYQVDIMGGGQEATPQENNDPLGLGI